MTRSAQFSSKAFGMRRRAARLGLASAALLLPAILATQPAPAQTFTLLHAFSGAPDGANPLGELIQDSAGNLYGTTQQGGNTGGACANSGLNGCGTVFKIDSSGSETVLYRFTGGTDGEFPSAGLVMDGAGNLYGTTNNGGSIGGYCPIGCGTVFKLTPAGVFSVLHAAQNYGISGGLAMDAAGNFYGSTTKGVFKLAPDGTFNLLTTNVSSQATLAIDAFGNLYGTRTFSGLTNSVCGVNTDHTCGIVFKVDTGGTSSTLYEFTGAGDDGYNPIAGVILDAAGNLYGTTGYGGAPNCLGGNQVPVGCGTIFKLTQAGAETVYSFQTGGGDHPVARLVRDAAGNLYGTTLFTGPKADSRGTVFEMRSNGTEAPLLHDFSGLADGNEPAAGLVMDASGNLYGTAQFGGVSGMGTVFKINPTGTPNYSLFVALFGSGTVTGSGLNCTSNCDGFFTSGTMVTLTATPATGSSFVGWSGGCTGTSTCSVTMNTDQSVGATFDSDFSLSATPLTPATVNAGGSSTSTINVVPAPGGFFSNVSLTCVVTPAPALAPTCAINPSSTPPGTPATLTVNTTPPAVAAVRSSMGMGLFYALCLPLIGIVGKWVQWGSDKGRRKGKQTGTALLFLLLAGLAFQVACGGGSSNPPSRGTPPGTYTITVKGTYTTGSLEHSTAPTLMVQ